MSAMPSKAAIRLLLVKRSANDPKRTCASLPSIPVDSIAGDYDLNADRVNRWITLFTNVSVVAGIIFLAVEVRQNTDSLDEARKQAAANAYQSRAFNIASMRLSNAQSPEMVSAITKFEAGGGEERPSEALATLSSEDYVRIQQYYFALNVIYDNNYYQYENGYLGEDRYRNVDSQVIVRFAPTWEALGMDINRTGFEREIERLMRQ